MTYPNKYNITNWLPVTVKDMKKRGWESADVILFTGDSYIDHPSFGAAVIGRVLEREGLKVVIVPQPNWQDDLRDFKKFGKPNLFFGVTSGNMDSMINHYTANKRLRSNDAYTADGRSGARPDYASYVYTKILKDLYPDTPVLLGGIEASLRRLTHYDYWSDSLKKSILYDTGADLLLYGMAEKSIVELVNLLKKGILFNEIRDIPQTAFLTDGEGNISLEKKEIIKLNSHEDCLDDKICHAKNFKVVEINSNKIHADIIIQKTGEKYIVVNPQWSPDEDGYIDRWYDLPYTRLPHPKYWKKGEITAYEMIKFSINIHRGCFGGCSFCTISAHQGKFIASRSSGSISKEADEVTKSHDFKGYISDIGGPSANMYKMKGMNLSICDDCIRPSCIYPEICKNLNISHSPLLSIYKEVRDKKSVKKAFIGSGVRYDLILGQNFKEISRYISTLMKYHVSGRLKVAPEHTSARVLKIMRKPEFNIFKKFADVFNKINKTEKLKEELIPYFISSLPGSENKDMAELAAETKNMNFKLKQIQDFTPTPMTMATVIYYTGVHPYTLKPVYTAKTKDEKLAQRKYFFWYKKG